VAFLKAALQKRVTEGGLDRARLVYTFYSHRVIPLAKRTIRMWEYLSYADPNRMSLEEMPDYDVWS
jgi:hypothetical protein